MDQMIRCAIPMSSVMQPGWKEYHIDPCELRNGGIIHFLFMYLTKTLHTI